MPVRTTSPVASRRHRPRADRSADDAFADGEDQWGEQEGPTKRSPIWTHWSAVLRSAVAGDKNDNIERTANVQVARTDAPGDGSITGSRSSPFFASIAPHVDVLRAG